MTDASSVAASADLWLSIDDHWCPIAFFLWNFNQWDLIQYFWQRSIGYLPCYQAFQIFCRRTQVPCNHWSQTFDICFNVQAKPTYSLASLSQDASKVKILLLLIHFHIWEPFTVITVHQSVFRTSPMLSMMTQNFLNYNHLLLHLSYKLLKIQLFLMSQQEFYIL